MKVAFQGSRVTSDAGLILVRALDERLGLEMLISEHLNDSRHGLNRQFSLAALLRESVYSQLAGYEDPNDAVRVSADPTFRLIGSKKLLDRGFTVFAVRHGSSPRFKIPEAYADVRRAVRFVRFHASTYGIDPDRPGVYGGSAGGHLSLMLGLASGEGNPSATDEVLRVSSRVTAVVAYYPPPPWICVRGRPAKASRLRSRRVASSLRVGWLNARCANRFVALDFEDVLSASASAILHVSSNDPPTLLVHGDADALVHVNNSQLIHSALASKGVETDLVVIEGAGHGFRTAEDQAKPRKRWSGGLKST